MSTKTMVIISIVITILCALATILMFYTGQTWLFYINSFLAGVNGICVIIGISMLRKEKKRKKYEEDVEAIWRSLKH